MYLATRKHQRAEKESDVLANRAKSYYLTPSHKKRAQLSVS